MTVPDVVALVRQAALEELPALVGVLAEAEAVARLRLNTAASAGTSGNEPEDRNLSAREAASRLGVSRPYLYKHADEYPFARRIGRRVVFDRRGLEAWNRGQRSCLTVGSLDG